MIWEFFIPIFIIVLVGFPHGAVDGVLILRVAGKSLLRAGIIFTGYVLIALITVLIWIAEPNAGLAILIVLSVYHFGRLDTSHSSEIPHRYLRGFVLGALPVIVISQAHQTEVEYLFRTIVTKEVDLLVSALRVFTFFWAALIFWLAIVRRVFSMPQLFEIAALSFVLILLPPLWGFAFYFCAIHSFRHFKSLRNSIFPISQVGWCVVGVLTIISIFLVVFGLTWFDNVELHKSLVQSTFIVLAALTMPHMILIDGYQILNKLGQDARPPKD